MSFTLTQRKEAYKKLPEKVQSFVMDPDTTDIISRYLNRIGLTDDQLDKADSEIFFSMLGLQKLSDAISNIVKLSNKKVEDFSDLNLNLERDVFDKLQNLRTQPGLNLSKKEIRDKTTEVSKKYSLNDVQTEKLVKIVESEPEQPETTTLQKKIISDLGVSGLLSEQIALELKKRVFDSLTKNPETDTKKTAPPDIKREEPKTQPQVKAVEQIINSPQPPEIPPNILPQTEKVSSAYRPISIPDSIKPPSSLQTPKDVSGVTYSSKNLETVQQPVKVPEIKIAPEPMKAPLAPANVGSVVETKLKSVTPSMSPPPQAEQPKKYAVDPYREPIE